MPHNAINQEVKKKQVQQLSLILFAPIMMLLAIVPLIARLKITEDLTDNIARIYKMQRAADFFSYYKAVWILITVAIVLFIVFLTLNKESCKKFKTMKVYIISTSVFLIFTVLSTVLSPYKEEALWGVPDRMEGIIIIGCYLVIMFYTVYAFADAKDYRYILIALSALVIVLTFMGIFEYMGKNLLLNTELGKSLLIPSQYAAYRDKIGIQYEKGKVYGTLFHYNYMGSFGALMVPLFGTLATCLTGIKEKAACALIAVASMFLLFGSTSRGGIIGLILAVFIGILLLSRLIIKKWKIVLPMSIGCISILIVFNMLTGGTIFERIPELIKDAVKGIKTSEQEVNYLDHIPIRNVMMQDGETIIVTQEDSLILSRTDTGIRLQDQDGNDIAFTETAAQLTIEDKRFESFILKKALDQNNNWAGIILNINGVDTLVFKIDRTQGIYLIDNYTQERIELDFPETFGFKGKERLGSARGYIWSRSIPMLKDTWLIGHGPDTFAFEFPQRDYLGKYYAYDTPNMIVDKPHNLYLQIGINQGLIALIAFLVIVFGYIAEGIKLYAFRKNYNNQHIIGIATMLSIIGYLGAGLFNDSVVSVAPVFWILLGAGIALNHINKHQSLAENK